METWIEVVDEKGDILLSLQMHELPLDVSAEELVKKILPNLSEMYNYRCYYTQKSPDESGQN